MEVSKISISVDINRPPDKTSCGLPARYILAILGFAGIALQFSLKVCLSVAIVAMVKSPKPDVNTTLSILSSGRVTVEDTCPGDELGGAENEDGEFEWNEATQGQILASYYYGYVAFQLVGGRLSEIFGSKLVLGPGLLITGLLTLVSPLCARSSMGLFIACRVLEGCASGVVIPALQLMVSDWFPPEERTRFSGIIFSSVHIGSLLGMGLSGYLAEVGGWPLIFYVFGGLSIVWFVPWMLLTYDTPSKHPRVSDKEKRYIMSGLGHTDQNKKVFVPVPWVAILTSPPVWAACAMHFGMTWVLYTFLAELPTYTKNVLHYNIKESGYISALPYIFTWMTSVGSGFLSQWLQEKKYVTKLTAYRIFNGISAIGPGISLLLLTFANCDRTLTVVLFVTTLSFGGCFIGATYLNFMELGINFSGTLSGLQHTIGTSPGFITPLVAGAIVNGNQTLAQWHIVFYIAMVITTLPFVVYMIFGSVEEQQWNNPKQVDKKDDKY